MKQTTLLPKSLGRTTSRRQVLLGGLAAIIAAGNAQSSIVRSSLGSMHLREAVGEGGWTNPYVTDGLIAMWDGEWNAGFGVHDASAIVWKDIAGGLDLTYSGMLGADIGYWDTDCFIAVAKGNYNWRATPSPTIIDLMEANSPITVEGVFSVNDSGSNNSCFLQVSNGTLTDGLMFAVYNSNSLSFSEADTWASGRGRVGLDASWAYVGKKIFASCIYGDGVVSPRVIVDEAITPSFSGISGAITKTPTSLTLGSYSWTSGMSRTAIGKYNTFRIYSRTLTSDEIAHNYAVDKERFGLP